MAKKKKTGKSKGGGKKKSSGSKGFINTDKLMGLAAAAFLGPKLEKIEFFQKLDPKMKAGAKILLGEWAPKQTFANSVGTPQMRQAAGDGLMYDGVKELMSSMGIAGVGKEKRKVRGNEYLAVSIEGLEDVNSVNDDVLSDDEMNDDDYEIGESVNDDEMNDDEMNDDDMNDDDLSSVNDDDDL